MNSGLYRGGSFQGNVPTGIGAAPDCNVPSAVGEVEQAMTRLAGRLEALHQRIDVMELRFSAVLRTEPPKQTGIGKDSGSTVLLANAIQTHAESADAAVDRLTSLVERCGI